MAIAVLLGAAGSLDAATGDTVKSLSSLVFGPVLYLVAAVGALACLYQFARGNKSALFLGIGGLLFLALARALIGTWFTGTGAPPLIPGGEFPVYGQSDRVAGASDTVARDYLRAYGYVGLVACNGVIRLMFALGLPVLVAATCAMRTYGTVTVERRPGAVVGYLIGVVLLAAFALVPTVTFVPADPAALRGGQIAQAVARMSAAMPSDALGDPERSAVPLAPALLIIAAVDLSEAIGGALNRQPATSEMAKIITASRAAQLSPRWLSEYRDYAMHCGAAFTGFVDAEYDYRADGFGESLAEVLRRHWDDGWHGAVPAAGLNLLSPWGDNVLSMVPLHGYTLNDALDQQIVATSGEPRAEVEAIAGQWVNPAPLAARDRRDRLIFQPASLARGPAGGATYAPQVALREGVEWKLPFGAARLSGALMLAAALNEHGWAVPFCSVPSDGTHAFPDLTLSREDDGTISWSQEDDFTGKPIRSRYLEDVFQTVARTRAVSFAPVDWGDAMRQSLLLDYGLDACHAACGEPSHKAYWGCLVTGRFVDLARAHGDCAGSAATTRYFWGHSPEGVSYGYGLQQALFSGADAKDRDTGILQDRALAGATSLFDPANDSTYGARLSAVDLILAAPGSLAQVALSSDAYSAVPDGGASLFGFLEQAPALGRWFMGAFVEVAYTLVQWLSAHLIGLTLAGFLAVYPLFALFALAPGRWHALADWGRCALWVLMWPVVVNLGLAAANAGAQSTGLAALLSAQPGAGETLMTFVGLALILLTPAISQVLLMPSLDTLARFGASLYGTGFRLFGGSDAAASLFSSDPSLAGSKAFLDAQQPSPWIAPQAAAAALGGGGSSPATAVASAPAAPFATRTADALAIGRAAQFQAAAYGATVADIAAPAGATAANSTLATFAGPRAVALGARDEFAAPPPATLAERERPADPPPSARAAQANARERESAATATGDGASSGAA